MGLISIKCDLIKGVFVVREGCGWRMPSDMVSFAVATGLGVSVIAGILSGVCYVWAHGVHRKSARKLNREWHCSVCGLYLRSVDRILDGDETVTCTKCKGQVCQTKCASKQTTGWTCKNCLRPPESWLQGILNAIQPSRKVQMATKMQTEPLNEIDEDLEALQKKGKEHVQDFIEKLVNAMLGQNVDDASVTKMYNDELYDGLFKKYHEDLSNTLTALGTSLHNSIANLPLTGQSPCSAHATLKQLIEKLLKEVVNIPRLQTAQENSQFHSDLNNKTYEDLLATAILNKVISSSQNTLPSSSAASISSRPSAASVSSRPSSSLRNGGEKEYFFGEETLESKWKTPDLETTSVSSLEEWLQSDSSFGSRKYVDRFTLTIKQNIEELSESDSENGEDDDYDDDSEYFSRRSLLDDDEPNWLLQKRKFQGTASPVPVPMLVPSPTTDAKVLIGDKEADETSDLSDAASDFGEAESVIGTHGLLLESKTIIGGKNPKRNGDSESESSADSGVKEVDQDRSEYDDSDFVQKTDITVDDDNVEDASFLSVYSNTEQEAEYTERYASLPRTIMKTPLPPSRPSLQKAEFADNRKIAQDSKINNAQDEEQSDEEDEQMLERTFSGSYSKREKEKWKNAVEMKNNPYSKENIEKRLKRSSSAVSSLFGSDYYAKHASSPSGTKVKSREAKIQVFGFPGEDEEIIGDILKQNQLPKKLDSPWPPKHPDKNQVDKKDLHTAVPVLLLDDGNGDSETRLQTREFLSTTGDNTSDSDLSFVNCYNVEKSQVYKKPKKKSDENGNNDTEKDKHVETEPENQTKETPTPRERSRYLKVKNATTRSVPVAKKIHPRELMRTKSESDLLDESLYSPPRVLTKRRDNTLISKIYLDPQVRSFVLSNRNKLPVETKANTFRSQLSLPETVLQAANNGSTLKWRPHSSYSSEEDLINSGKISKNEQMLEVRNYNVINSTFSVSSEDDRLSEHSSRNLGSSRFSKQRTFSSYEDLLSAVDQEQPQRKKDNTLISKIYQQQHVRNYALSNRECIPYDETPFRRTVKSVSSDEDVFIDDSSKEKFIDTRKGIRIDVTLENSTTSKGIEEMRRERNTSTPDSEIDEIAKKKIVHNILDQIAGIQQPKPIAPRRKLIEERQISNNTDDEITISVKELRRKFEKDQGASKVVSSLTARSLSRQMKQSLKN